MQHHILFSLALTLSSTAVAQSYTAHLIDNLSGGTSQNIPFAGNSTTWDEARSQYLFQAAFLPPTGGAITGVSVVPSATYVMPYERFEIWMDHTTNSPLSTTFASNLTAPVLVFSQSPGTVSYTAGTWSPITFTTPFVYDGVRNVVMEVRKKIDRPLNPPTTTVATYVLTYPRRTTPPPPIWANGTYGSGAVDAVTATTTYSTHLLMRLQWSGQRTLTVNSTRDVTGNANRAYFHIGATVTVTGQGQPGEFMLAAIDLGLLPMWMPVPPILGGLWLPGPVIFGSGVLDGSGRASASVSIPSNTLLIGMPTFYQAGILGSSLAFTNVVDGPIAAY